MQVDDQFAEQGVGPGEPVAGEGARVVLVEGFVHEAGAGMRGFQPLQALAQLCVVVADQCVLNDRHRPDGAHAAVRAADAFGCFTAREIRVAFAPGQLARAQKHRVGAVAAAQVGQAEQSGCIGVVDKQLVAEAVHFERPIRLAVGIALLAELAGGGCHFIGERGALGGEGGVAMQGRAHRRQLP